MVIYSIKNKTLGKEYIGSTSNFPQRKRRHLTELRRNLHTNKKLQNAWNKYGAENFDFSIVEECREEDLNIREQYYINTFKPFYNIRTIADRNAGIKKSRESIERQAQAIRKEVLQLDKDWNLVREWNSLREAASSLKISESNISSCCNGRIRSYKGFVWKFKDLYIPYRYNKLSSAEASRLNGQKSSKSYTITYRDNTSQVIHNFSSYCRENGFDRQILKYYIGKPTMNKLGYEIRLNEDY